jgi:hypothetical protein
MPLVSEAQRKFMWAKHPEIAKRWEAMTPKTDSLPQRSAGQDQEHTEGDDYKHLTPSSYARFPGSLSERQATEESGVQAEPQSFGAKSTHKGLRARDVAAARVKKGR